MTKKTLTALALFIMLIFTQTAFAYEIDPDAAELSGANAVSEALPEEAAEIMGDMSLSDALDLDGALSRLFSGIKDKAAEAVKAPLRSAAVIVLAVLLASAASAVFESAAAQRCINLALVLVIASAAVYDVRSYMAEAESVILTISDFSKVLLPSMAAAAAAAGAVSSASAKYLATSLFMDVLLTAASGVVLPLIYAYCAASVAGAATEEGALDGAAKLIKWLFTAVLSAIVLAFTGYLTLTGVISGSADAVTLRLTKAALSAVPVVGKAISDATGAVIAGAGMLRSALGAFGMIAVCALCVAPVLKLGASYLLYKAASAVADILADKRISKLLANFGTAFGAALGCVSSGAAIIFISLIASLKAVSGS